MKRYVRINFRSILALLIAIAMIFGNGSGMVAKAAIIGTDWSLNDEGLLTIVSDAGMAGWRSGGIFYNGNVKNVIIGDGVTIIEATAFHGCGHLKSITIPNSVTTIGATAFFGTSLETITIPDSVTSIGENAFQNSTSLREVTFLGAAQPTFGTKIFNGCTALEKIYVPAGSINDYKTATNLTIYKAKIFAPSSKDAVTNHGKSHTVTYTGVPIVLSTLTDLFTLNENAGERTYSLETGGTGAGTLAEDHKTLTVTKAGEFQIGLTTAETDTHQAGAKVTATLTVNKGTQSAPTGLSKADATIHGGSDGKITGLTPSAQYEYKKDDGVYTAATTNASGEITGLAAGSYVVRLAGNNLYNAGADSSVLTIGQPDGGDPVALTGVRIVGDKLMRGVGETLTVIVTPEGATVTYQWQSSSDSLNYDAIPGKTGNIYEIQEGDNNKYIRVVATGRDGYSGEVTSNSVFAVKTILHTSGGDSIFTVGGGPIAVDPGITIDVEEGLNLVISANIDSDNSWDSDKLSVSETLPEGVAPTDNSNDITIEFEGTFTAEKWQSILRAITFETEEEFDRELIIYFTAFDGSNYIGIDFKTIKIQLPKTLQEIENQTLTELKAGYAAGSQETKAITLTKSGTETVTGLSVALSGDQAERFVVTQPAVTTLNEGTPSTTFTVKAKDGLPAGTYTATVTVSAAGMTDLTFTVTQVVNEAVRYSVTVNNGTGGGSFAEGSNVSITANSAPANQVFDRWTTTTAGVIFANANTASTSFRMPARNVTVTATYRTINDRDDGGTGGGVTPAPPKTITVTETSSQFFSGSKELIKVKANVDNAFSNSIELKIADTGESAASFGLSSELEVYPFDISLYVRGTNTKTQPAEGYAVTISLPVPENLLDKKDGLNIVHKDDKGLVTTLNSRITQIDGVWYIVFDAAQFSPYALVVGNPSTLVIPDRLYGQSRYATAVEIAKAYFPKGAETVILARGDISADALPAATLARKYKAPLLLTYPDRLPEGVLAEIKALGATRVMIIGGPGAVEPTVEANLKSGLGNTVSLERIYGQSRYDTAYEIALRLGNATGQAVLVNGDNYQTSFPDALSVSAWSGYYGVPILYVDSQMAKLPEATTKALNELKVSQTVLVGGTGVIPTLLENQAPNPKRFGGMTRYDTNVEVLRNLQPNSQTVYVATGESFADALAGAAVAAQNNSWVILIGGPSNELTLAQENLLKEMKGKIKSIHALGGPAVVPEATMERVKSLLDL